MTPLIVLAVHCTLSLTLFSLLSRWYLMPKISMKNVKEILAILLVVNAFRYLPLSLYMPGQVAPDFPEHVRTLVAFGDFISAILAITALILLKSKSRLATIFLWMFSLVSVVDMILALYYAMTEKVYNLPLGVNYFTVSVYVPLLIVIQFVILKLLINKKYK